MAQEQGLLIKDADGNLYFLRPEILAATKVTPAEIQAAPAEYKLHVEALRTGGDMTGYAEQAALQPVGGLKLRVGQPAVGGATALRAQVKETVMCPW